MLDHFLQDHMTLLAGGVAVAIALIILLRWTGQRVVVPQARAALKGDGSFDYDVAGTSAHQPVLARIAGRSGSIGEERIAELTPLPSQAGESTAIWVHVEGARVGEIAARDVAAFHAVLAGRPAQCDAVVIDDDLAGGLIVRLDVMWPPQLR